MVKIMSLQLLCINTTQHNTIVIVHYVATAVGKKEAFASA